MKWFIDLYMQSLYIAHTDYCSIYILFILAMLPIRSIANLINHQDVSQHLVQIIGTSFRLVQS